MSQGCALKKCYHNIKETMKNINILELDEEELEFIRNRYPDIDTGNLLEHLPGMEVLTFLDKLETLIKNDIEDLRIIAFDYEEYQLMMNRLKQRDDWPERQYTWKMLFRVGNRITHYRKYGSRNRDPELPKEFTIEEYCKQADELARKCIGAGIGNTYTDRCMERIDRTIIYLKSLGRHLDHDSYWDIAVVLGTKLGELMLEDKLKAMGYEWHMDDNYNCPVIKNPDDNAAANPIGKILKMLESEDDDEGTCKDFYDTFLFMLKKENRDLLKIHSYFDIVKQVIDEWDPMDLFDMGCPEDEYDGESYRISNDIESNFTTDEIAEVIAECFSLSFGETFTVQDCMKPAQKIYKLWQLIHFVGKQEE